MRREGLGASGKLSAISGRGASVGELGNAQDLFRVASQIFDLNLVASVESAIGTVRNGGIELELLDVLIPSFI